MSEEHSKDCMRGVLVLLRRSKIINPNNKFKFIYIMNQHYLSIIASLVFVIFFNISCEQDRFLEPELKPKTYSFNIPNRISFNFSQLSENRESIIPYTNTLTLKNTSNIEFSGRYAIFAFKDVTKDYGNIAFIKYGSFSELPINTLSDSISLEQSNNLFTDDNLIASIINFNNASSDHGLNGFYTGELNIFSPAPDDSSEPTFVRSITCTGFIDFEGQFHFFVHNDSEDNVVHLQGNFNTSNQVSGNILNREANNLSVVTNDADTPFTLIDSNLTGGMLFSENSEARILKFNLSKQN